MNPLLKKILIIGSILLLPSLFYLVLITGKNKVKPLEIYGPKEVSLNPETGKTDTVYHTIHPFRLIAHTGDSVTQELVRNKIFVTDFFFATCKSICPKMSNQLMRVQDKFAKNKNVLILSHSVDPQNDTPENLRQYSMKYRALKDKWYFLTGDKKQIYDLARHSYYLPVMDGDGGDHDFIHSEQFVLVDNHGRIRGFYDGTSRNEVDKLMEEIKVLLFEMKEEKSAEKK
ncbi:MAG: SCO family protein [Bacteroidia bacterium]|nr:SCO family protein [Bacteroidia bacterium]